MALRVIVKNGDPILRKKCKVVDTFNERLWTLLDDMKETMMKADGVGLAGPQVGMLKRLCVIDAGEGYFELINPEIISYSGEQRDTEGCLSCPNQWGYVTRPNVVTFKAQDRNGKEYQMTVEGLFARAVCHELDHLDGKLFIDLVEEFVEPEN